MEKVTFKSTDGVKLVGVLHKPSEGKDKAIIISHGSASNKEKPRLIKLAKSFAKDGYTSLRFDYRGSGESEDKEINIKDLTDDLN